jgi:hypothetical protein
VSDRIQALIDAGRLVREPAPDEEIAGLWANAIEAFADARFTGLSANGRMVRAYDAGRIAATAVVRAHDLRVRATNHRNRDRRTNRAARRSAPGGRAAGRGRVRHSALSDTKLSSADICRPLQPARPAGAHLYGLTTQADQKVGRDAVERYAVLRRELDAAQAEARAVGIE